MTSTADPSPASSWVTIWLSPRRTIDGIVATRPRHLVLLLAGLGAISGFCSQLIGFGFISPLLDWRIFLGLSVVSAIIGIGWLYLAALMFGGVARLFGGRAAAVELRAAFAWSAVPAIAGFVVMVGLLAAWRFSGDEGFGARGGFSLLLTAVGTAFAVWSLVVTLAMLSRLEQFGFWRTVAAYAPVLILPILAASLIRALLFQPFQIPAASMIPTLLVGDHFFVSKYAYGYSHHTWPFSLAPFSGRILGSEPVRGDVVAFLLPKDNASVYIKRVVGLPGDRIQMKQGLLHINDVPVARGRLEDFVGEDACGGTASTSTKRWRETLPNGVSYQTLDCVDNGFFDDTNVYSVPSGHFFMLGDNRDNSTDSRVLSTMGYVPLENIIGRAAMIYFSGRRDAAGGTSDVRNKRFGLIVR